MDEVEIKNQDFEKEKLLKINHKEKVEEVINLFKVI